MSNPTKIPQIVGALNRDFSQPATQPKPSFGRRLLSGLAGFTGAINPILGAGFGLLQGLLNKRQSRWNAEKTLSTNLALQQREFSNNLAMWRMMNKYNHPAQQMARLKSAGLNPRMIYGSGAASATGQATQLPKYTAPKADYSQVQPYQIMPVISQYQDVRLKNAQIDNVEALTKRADQQNALLGVQKVLTETKTDEIKRNIEVLGERLKGLQYDNDYKKFVSDLAKDGWTVRDPKYLRVIWTKLKQAGVDPGGIATDVIKGIYNWLKNVPADGKRNFDVTRDYMQNNLSDQAIMQWLKEFFNLTLHKRYE